MFHNDLLIKELKLDIDIDQANDFENVALNSSNIVNNLFIDVLQKVVDILFNTNEKIFINTIEIDLGEIDFKNTESISEKFYTILLAELKKIKRSTFYNPRSNELLIAYFLKFGFLPWWASSNEKFNNFISANSYNKKISDELLDLITKNKSNYHRLLNILSLKNQSVFFKNYLQKNYSHYKNSKLFFDVLLQNSNEDIAIEHKINIDFRLFSAFYKNQNNTSIAFSAILNEVMKDLNINWNSVASTLNHKSKNNKRFSELIPFNEDIYLSREPFANHQLSELKQLKIYLNEGLKNRVNDVSISSLIILFNRLLIKEKKSLAILFSQINIHDNSLKLFRLSKLINFNNIGNFIALSFDSHKTRLIKYSFDFLKSIENRKMSNSTSFFTFISLIIEINHLHELSTNKFLKALLTVISKKYKLKYSFILYELYRFSSSRVQDTEYQELIENLYKNELLKNNIEINQFLNRLKSTDKLSTISLLSSHQNIQFNLLKKHLLYLNKSIVHNSWSSYDTENFILEHLSKQITGAKNTVINILKVYGREFNFDIHKLIISILLKFYPKGKFPDKEIIEILEYIIFINNPDVLTKLSKKEKKYLKGLIDNQKIKEKIDLASYNYNTKLSTYSYNNHLEYLKSLKIDSFLEKRLIYLIGEYDYVFKTKVKSSLNKNQLSQILRVELKKNSRNDHTIIYEKIFKSISELSNTSETTIIINLLERLVGKASVQSLDFELLKQISNSLFNLNSLSQSSKNSINYIYELINKIKNKSIKKSLLHDYLVKSKIAVLILNDKNYKSLIQNLTTGKNNDYFLILNNLISFLPFHKQIEFSSILKLKVLQLVSQRNLTEGLFIFEILNQIRSMDAFVFKKIEKNLHLSLKPNSDIPSLEKIVKTFWSKNKDIFSIHTPSSSIDSISNDIQYKNIDDVFENKTTFLEFINPLLNNFDSLIKFAKETLKKQSNSQLNLLFKYQQILLDIEKEMISFFQKTKFFPIDTTEFKIFLRATILKSFAFSEQNNQKIIISDVINDLLNNLSEIEKVDLAKIKIDSLKKNRGTFIEKEMVRAIVSFFGKPIQDDTQKTEKITYTDNVFENKTTFLEFINPLLNNFDSLIKFAKETLKKQSNSQLNLLFKYQQILLDIEKEMISFFQKTKFFPIDTTEFKIFLRATILKSFAFSEQNNQKIIISDVINDLLNNLSEIEKVDLAKIKIDSLKKNRGTFIEKEMVRAIVSFFGKPIQDDTQKTEKITYTDYSDRIVKHLSSFISPQRNINFSTHKDFDYFLNLKNELIAEIDPGFLPSTSYKSIDEIIENKSTLIRFLNLYIDDFEVMIEFAQASMTDQIKKRFESLLKSIPLLDLEKELIRLHKDFLFSTLNSFEFKTILRVFILKKFALSFQHDKKIDVSAFTFDFIENLSKNRKINFKQTANILLDKSTKTTIEENIFRGITSFFDKNNFEPISKAIKDDIYNKNLTYFFLKKNQIPKWSLSSSLNMEDVIDFIKLRIKNKDGDYVRELFLDVQTNKIMSQEFSKETNNLQLDILELLESFNYKSFSVRDFYNNIVRFGKKFKYDSDQIFHHIVSENLYDSPSITSVFEEVLILLKKQGIDNEEKFLGTFKEIYPVLKLIDNQVSTIDDSEKKELIRYYIQKGKFTKINSSKKSIILQLLRTYARTQKEDIRSIIIEFSGAHKSSHKMVEIISKPIFIELLIEELEIKNLELKHVFEKNLRTDSTHPTKKEIEFYDLLLSRIIAKKTVQYKHFKNILDTIKTTDTKLYKSVVNYASKLISETIISSENSFTGKYLKSIKDNIDDKSVKKENLKFSDFLKNLRYFVEFRSFNRANQSMSASILFDAILQFKSNLILKKQLHNWSKQRIKISTLFKLFPKKNPTELIDFIYPNQMEYINRLNSILRILNYNQIEFYLNLDSDEKLTLKLLTLWSKHNVIINTPYTIIYSLFENFASHPSINLENLVEEMQNVEPSLNVDQKEMVSSILKNIFASLEKKSADISENSANNEDTNDLSDSVYINNAGLIIIWPFLSTLFSKLGLTEGRNFIDDYSLQKAILTTHYVVYEDEKIDESDLVLNKILCGASPDFFVDVSIKLSDMDKSIGRSLLVAVTKNWDKLSSTSIQSLRDSFLKRDGIVKKKDKDYSLKVETKPYDLLLKTIPWNIKMIQTTFMDNRLLVEWKI